MPLSRRLDHLDPGPYDFSGVLMAGPDANFEDLIDRYCDAWTETDPTRRSELLDAVWAVDATYTDPNVTALGKTELLAHIAKIQAGRPGARVRRMTVIDEHHEVLRFEFGVVGPEGAVLRHGTDIAFLDASRARLQRVIGFFGGLAPLRNDS
jgi:hypothetical protein